METTRNPRQRGRILRILLPPKIVRVEPERDLVKEGLERKGRRGSVVALLAYAPLVGVLAVAVNLMIQVRGFQSLALAVVQNMPLASLAFVIAVNALIYLLPGLTAGFVQVATDERFSTRVRRVSAILIVALLFIGSFVLAWYLTLVIGLLSLLAWRFGHLLRRRATSPPSSDIARWLEPPVPVDFKLRALWLEGRQRLAADGAALAAVPVIQESTQSSPRTLSSVTKRVNKRLSAVRQAQQRTTSEAISLALFSSLIGYAAILLVQIQLAPLERVEIENVGSKIGYVFSQSAGGGVFVSKGAQEIYYLDQNEILGREICATPTSSKPLFYLAAPTRTNAVECLTRP